MRIIISVLLFSLTAHAERIDFNSMIEAIETAEQQSNVISPNRIARATSKRNPSSENEIESKLACPGLQSQSDSTDQEPCSNR